MLNINNYEEIYKIDSKGNIYNKDRKLKTYLINSGYEAVKLTKNGVRQSFLVHRLVAMNYIPNPNNLPEVNHIDGNKLNNDVSNLEWVSTKCNRHHAKEQGLWVYNKPTQGKKMGSSSRYRYVSWDKAKGKWSAYLGVDGVAVGRKRFDCEHDAGRHVNNLILQHNSHVALNIIED